MADRRAWNPETAREWQRIFRDIGTSMVGWFILIWQTVIAHEPHPLLVGAGLILLGVAPALRLDEKLRGKQPSVEIDP